MPCRSVFQEQCLGRPFLVLKDIIPWVRAIFGRAAQFGSFTGRLNRGDLSIDTVFDANTDPVLPPPPPKCYLQSDTGPGLSLRQGLAGAAHARAWVRDQWICRRPRLTAAVRSAANQSSSRLVSAWGYEGRDRCGSFPNHRVKITAEEIHLGDCNLLTEDSSRHLAEQA
jgi:hypothetical protein